MRSLVLLLVGVASVVPVALAFAQDAKPAPAAGHDAVAPTSSAVPVPSAREFTKLVLEVVKSYPTDGTHRYHWPKGSSWTGTTQDLVYDGVKVGTGDPEKRCYCCGLTFEVFFKAWERYCEKSKRPFRILDLDAKGVVQLRRWWFGDGPKGELDRKTVAGAVLRYGLGKAVKLEDARAGDFCQLWRHSGSGHSVIVLDVEKDAQGKPAALRYWSTQGSTNGIHDHVERFSSEKSGVKADETYVVRVGHD